MSSQSAPGQGGFWDWLFHRKGQRYASIPETAQSEKQTDAVETVWRPLHQGDVAPNVPISFNGHPVTQKWMEEQDELVQRYPVPPGYKVPTQPKLRYLGDGREQHIQPQAAIPTRYDRQLAVVPIRGNTEGIQRIGPHTPFRPNPLQRLDQKELPDFLRQSVPTGALPIERYAASGNLPTLLPERVRQEQEWQPPEHLTKLPPIQITPAADLIYDLPTATPAQIAEAMADFPSWLNDSPQPPVLVELRRDDLAITGRKADPVEAERAWLNNVASLHYFGGTDVNAPIAETITPEMCALASDEDEPTEMGPAARAELAIRRLMPPTE